jgi:hypothetical protein
MHPENSSKLPDTTPRPHSATDERRAAEREGSNASLRLTVDTLDLEGTTENISGVGVLFFSEGCLRVSVEIEEGGRRRVRKGRLVRVQRMSLENTGFAVEFDPE